MASGYLNSAGTDLDNLFLVDNGNAGAIGFQVSNGQDLGNRFSAASTLGYNLGYKNSAGTDIGYLRGKMVAPTISFSYDKTWVKHQYDDDGDPESNLYWVIFQLKITPKLVVTNNQPLSNIRYQLQINWNYNSSYLLNYDFTTDTGVMPPNKNFSYYKNKYVSPDHNTHYWGTLVDWNSTNLNSLCCIAGETGSETDHSSTRVRMRMIVTASNAVGSATITTPAISFF